MPRLSTCLEEIARLGSDYVVNECGYEWEARELLTWLADTFPHELERLVFFLRPDRFGDGAIYEAGSSGELTCAVPLYRVERQRVTARDAAVRERTPDTQPEEVAARSQTRAAISLPPPLLERST